MNTVLVVRTLFILLWCTASPIQGQVKTRSRTHSMLVKQQETMVEQQEKIHRSAEMTNVGYDEANKKVQDEVLAPRGSNQDTSSMEVEHAVDNDDEQIKELAEDKKILAQETFKVSIDMYRDGERRVSKVLISGRPPTSAPCGQGHHIVAEGLLHRAIQNHIKDSRTYVPKGETTQCETGDKKTGKNTECSIIDTLKHILGSDKVQYDQDARFTPPGEKGEVRFTKQDISEGNKLPMTLETLSQLVEFETPFENSRGTTNIREQVRRVLVVRGLGIARITEYIIRLWNKRKISVYYVVKKTGKNKKVTAKIQNDFAAIFRNNNPDAVEKDALRTLENENKKKAPVANEKEKEEKDENVRTALSKLIDLCKREEKQGEIDAAVNKVLGNDFDYPWPNVVTYAQLKEESVKEAVRLAKLAFPALKEILEGILKGMEGNLSSFTLQDCSTPNLENVNLSQCNAAAADNDCGCVEEND